MHKLQKIKSSTLKRVVIGLGLVTAFGAGYQLNEAKWQQHVKETKAKIGKSAPTSFRFDEYTPEGVKIADLEAIDAMQFKNPDSAKFAAFHLDSLTEDSLQSIADLTDENGQPLVVSLSFDNIDEQKNALLQEIDTVYSENFLKTGKQYYNLLLLEIYKCSNSGQNHDLWEKNDDELRREVNFRQSLMKVKIGVMNKMRQRSAYPRREFERDFRRARMAQSLRQERMMRAENNKAVAYLIAASEQEQRAAFEKHKDSLRHALYKEVETKRQAKLDSLMHPFKYVQQSLWLGACGQKGLE